MEELIINLVTLVSKLSDLVGIIVEKEKLALIVLEKKAHPPLRVSQFFDNDKDAECFYGNQQS